LAILPTGRYIFQWHPSAMSNRDDVVIDL